MLVKIYYGDNLEVLRHKVADGSIDLIYIDPPFNTGKKRLKEMLKTKRSSLGTRKGFGGNLYCQKIISSLEYQDSYNDDAYLDMIYTWGREAYRCLSERGSIFFHIGTNFAAYARVILDHVFRKGSFKNEIIWAYDYGGRPKNRWPAKHDHILWYAKSANDYIFNYDAIDRIPYMAPGLVGPEKASRGKVPSDTWWGTIVPTNGREKTGYPTQKPLWLLERIIRVHSEPTSTVLDFFAGSGTTGEAAAHLGRNCILVDNNRAAVKIIKKRLANYMKNG